MDVLHEAENDTSLSFKELLFRPSELLAHLFTRLKHFHSFSDVRETSCLGFWILEDPGDPDLKNAAH